MASVEWKYHLVESETMETLGEIKKARSKTLNRAYLMPGSAAFEIPMDYALFKDVEAIHYGIIAYRNKHPEWSGYIHNMQEDWNRNRIAVNCVGWFETLNGRIIRQDVGYPPYGVGDITAGQIVFGSPAGTPGTVGYFPGGLLTIANAQRDTWIRAGTDTDVMKRIQSYKQGQSIGAAISELSTIEGGFNFAIDPLSREMDITNWDEFEDKSDSVVFGFNWGPKNIQDLGRLRDSGPMVNRMTTLGRYGGGFAEDLASQEFYQLIEEQNQLSDVVDPNVLLAYAGGEVTLRSTPRILYTVKPFSYSAQKKAPQPFDDYNLGDKVSFSAIKGNKQIRGQDMRVFGINISITEEGNEKLDTLQITPS